MTTTSSPTAYYLGFVPADWTRHLHASLDEGAVCGAPSVPQGERASAAYLHPTCEACTNAAFVAMVPGTIPAGSFVPAAGGWVLRASLTAYEVESDAGDRCWVPFVDVHGIKAATPLVVLR